MWFWVFMMAVDLLVPFTMLYFGRRFIKKPPKEVNAAFGYRTTMSMKSRETWEFAHHYCGKLWQICGLLLLPISFIIMLFFLGKNIVTVSIAGGGVCAVQSAIMLCTLIPTELALRRNFDRNGFKR